MSHLHIYSMSKREPNGVGGPAARGAVRGGVRPVYGVRWRSYYTVESKNFKRVLLLLF